MKADNSFHLSHSGSEDASEPIKDASGFRVVSKPLVLQKTYRLAYNTVNVVCVWCGVCVCLMLINRVCSVAVAHEGVLSLRLLLWLKEDVFVAIACGDELNQSRLLVLTPAETQSSEPRLDIRYRPTSQTFKLCMSLCNVYFTIVSENTLGLL